MDQLSYDDLSLNIVKNLDRINQLLTTARIESKLITVSADLPQKLQQLSKDEFRPSGTARDVSPSRRPSEEEIDALFDAIRLPGHQSRRIPSQQRKILPLQQSQILNETNLNGGSCGSLTELSDSKMTHPKQAIDVDALWGALSEIVAVLAKQQNQPIEPIALDKVARKRQQEWMRLQERMKYITGTIDELEKYIESELGGDRNLELIGGNLAKQLSELTTNISEIVFIKNNEYMPDLSNQLVNDQFPITKLLDDINENIRQNKL